MCECVDCRQKEGEKWLAGGFRMYRQTKREKKSKDTGKKKERVLDRKDRKRVEKDYSQMKTWPMAPHTEKPSMSQPTEGCLVTNASASASSPRSQNEVEDDDPSLALKSGLAEVVRSMPSESASAVCARYGEKSR